MKKLKLYLDTSVISHLFAPDAPEKMADTLKLWKDIQDGKYIIVISTITTAEMDNCPEPKCSAMFSELDKIDKTTVNLGNEAVELADLYINYGGLSPNNIVDARHIAVATVSGCDIIVTWNFKHMINFNAIRVVDAVNRMESYGTVNILSPTSLLSL
jgi:predicted nucleic acid-binding protein